MGERDMTDNYQFGIEEEYFLVDADTKAVTITRPDNFLTTLKSTLGNQVSSEMLQPCEQPVQIDAVLSSSQARALCRKSLESSEPTGQRSTTLPAHG